MQASRTYLEYSGILDLARAFIILCQFTKLVTDCLNGFTGLLAHRYFPEIK